MLQSVRFPGHPRNRVASKLGVASEKTSSQVDQTRMGRAPGSVETKIEIAEREASAIVPTSLNSSGAAPRTTLSARAILSSD